MSKFKTQKELSQMTTKEMINYKKYLRSCSKTLLEAVYSLEYARLELNDAMRDHLENLEFSLMEAEDDRMNCYNHLTNQLLELH